MIKPSQYTEMLQRLEQNRGRTKPPTEGAERETGPGGLREQVLEWCAAQWPRWKVNTARTDKRSTLELGVHDLTVYAPGGRTLNVELKSRTGKLSPTQRTWARELELLGHRVHVVRSMADWFVAVDKEVWSKQSL